jgi:3-keto-5-aminohexanoate cleavage enzyme
VHFHARKVDGRPDHAPQAQAECVRAIRARSDTLVHPTLGFSTADGGAAARIAPILALTQDAATRPDFVPFDMGSVNVDWYEARQRDFASRGKIYANGTGVLEHFARSTTAHELTACAVSGTSALCPRRWLSST